MSENEITKAIIGACIEVHRELGPGLIESPYEDAVCHELHLRGIRWERQKQVPLLYKGVRLGKPLILDLLVEDKVIVDLKAKEIVTGLDKTRLRTYLRLSKLGVGLIINFNVELLRDGITRIVNDFIEPELETEPRIPPDLHV
jgi:GxxExxY protein